MIEEQNAFLGDVVELIHFAQSKGFLVTGGELYRPQEMQEIYVKQGKSNALYSQHGKRLAIDLNFFFKANGMLTYKKDDLQEIGDYWESIRQENRWGGNFKSIVDTPHFERT